MLCTVCYRVDPTTDHSLEFDLLLCDSCHGRALAAKQAIRERPDPTYSSHNRSISEQAFPWRPGWRPS